MRVVVCVGGGIAAFKAVELVRELMRGGARVRVAMTPSATRFVGPATFAGITAEQPLVDLWSHAGEAHVELGGWADAVAVAPATMNLIARWAGGQANDAVLATLACTRAPRIFAPAMHTAMWEQAATRRNVERLVADGAVQVGPVAGPLASGESGMGRMAEPADIAAAVWAAAGRPDLAGLHVLVTAGPTHEDLDPVRFLGNRSTGRMGFAVAERARERGARVTLVHGPVPLAPPADVEVVPVRSALEMHREVVARASTADAVVMAAAVADYRPTERADQKLKKGQDGLTLPLSRNPDILAELGASRSGPRPVLVGFAVETEHLLARARDKRTRKKVDLVVANDAAVGFGGDDNQAVLVGADSEEPLPAMSKRALADRILDRVRALLPDG